MKITIVQGAFLPVPALMGGAVEKVWFALGREFAQRGHVVTHISRSYGDLADDESEGGVRHMRIPGFNAPSSLILLKALDLVYSFRALRSLPAADILVTNTFWLPLLNRDSRKGETYIHVARFPKGQMRFYSHASRLQTVSQSVAEAIRREVPRLASKVCVIPYPLIDGVPKVRLNTKMQKAREILFVGRIHPEKGVHLLISAIAAMTPKERDDWRLVIIGPTEARFGGGGDRYHQELLRLADPIADRIDWIGPIFDSNRLAEAYQRAAVFVYPSLADRGETFGLAPLEAMAHGCVPLVSDLQCFQEYVESEVSGRIFNHRVRQPVSELANRLAELLGDEETRSKMSAAARTRARDFVIDRVAERYLEDFDAVMNTRPAKGGVLVSDLARQ